jgi:hypothetical protein
MVRIHRLQGAKNEATQEDLADSGVAAAVAEFRGTG